VQSYFLIHKYVGWLTIALPHYLSVSFICLKNMCCQVDIAYIPFVERLNIFLLEVFKYDIAAADKNWQLGLR
jgi:hypothetical protein